MNVPMPLISHELTNYNAARQALQQAASVDEVKQVKDKAEAIRLYAQQQKDSALETYAAEIKLRATRRLGELSRELPKAEVGGAGGGAKVPLVGKSKKDTLKEAGVSKSQAYRAEALAEVQHEELEKYVAEKKAAGKPVSAEEVVKRIVGKKKKEERNAKIVEIATRNTSLTGAKQYPVIYADPPWQYDHSMSISRDIENQYPTMPLEDICALNVKALAAPDAILFLWCPASHIRQGLRVIEAWGFTYRSSAVWDKEKMGMGYWFRTQHELLLVAVRGNMTTPAENARPRSVIREKSQAHSKKPAILYDIIEKMYPTFPRIELFSRNSRNGWDAWGNEQAKSQ